MRISKKPSPNCLLSAAPESRPMTVTLIDAGHGLNRRLAEMGILPGATLTVLQNRGKGQCVVQVQNSRLVLGRGMAHKIHVRSKSLGVPGREG